MKTIVMDAGKCIGCRNCQVSCKDEHVGNDWLPVARSQSEGQFWLKVGEHESGSGMKVKVEWSVVMCQHCREAPCMKACPDQAIYRRPDEIVLIDPVKCNGCKDCIAACPYGVIYFNSDLNISQKCTLCAHLLDRGWKEPRCVTACPTEALRFLDEAEVNELGVRKEYLLPAENTQPRVVYLNLAKPFLAGEVYSPAEDACLEGVLVSATHVASGNKTTGLTDNYGDFTLKVFASGEYQLSLEKEGYYSKQITSLKVPDALNVGEIKLFKRPI